MLTTDRVAAGVDAAVLYYEDRAAIVTRESLSACMQLLGNGQGPEAELPS